MAAVFADRGGDPTAPASATRFDPLLWRAERARRALLGRRRARRRPPRLAHRVHRDRAGPPRPPVRRPGRRHRPRLPAPRDERGPVGGPHRRRGLRPPLRAPGDGRLRGREDEQVQGQPRARVEAARRRASTRWRSGSCCSPSTTAPTGTTPPDLLEAAQARLDRWREALSVNLGADAAVTVAAVRAAVATTSTPPARSPPSTPGPTAPWPVEWDDAVGAGPAVSTHRRRGARHPPLTVTPATFCRRRCAEPSRPSPEV